MGMLLLATAAAAWYGYSLWRHPYRICWLCHGGKGHRDGVSPGAFGNCWACGSSGRHVRWGVRLFMRGTYRKIQAGEKGRNY